MSASEIAAAAGMKLAAFHTLIQRARKAGDLRAVYRDGEPVRAPREPGAPSTQRLPAFKRGPYTHSLLPDTAQSCDIGVDRWSYRLASLEEIREYMAATPDVPEEMRLGREMEAES